jgi:hypothetical protein
MSTASSTFFSSALGAATSLAGSGTSAEVSVAVDFNAASSASFCRS